jgi:hypothetical protein
MARTARLPEPTSLLDQVDTWLAEQKDRDACAEVLIERYVDEMVPQAPGVPRGNIRRTEVDGRAVGYCYATALQVLREKLRI